MRVVWIAIIVASAVPLLFAGALLNPVFILILGIAWWRDWRARLYPYRWWIVLSGLVCAFSVTVYTIRYA